MKKVTEKSLLKLQPKTGRYTVPCGESLFLRVHPSGVKSWVLRAYLKGVVRDITLGRHPDLSLLQARQAAHLKRQELEIKPSAGLTFNDALRLWKSKKKGHIVSYEDELARINAYLTPKLGRLPLEQITAPVALNLLMELDDKLPTLRRVLMRLNEVLDLAVCAGLINSNPCRKLSKVFAQHVPEHRPYIPAEELGKLFEPMKDCKLWFKCYALLAVYTMLRPKELSAVRRAWIDGDVLTIPPEHMKKHRQHRIPLCPEVLQLIAVLRNQSRHKRSPYLLPFGRGGHPINKQHLSKWLLHTPLKGKLCHHGLRATGRTWMRDQGVAHEVAEDALAHLTMTQTERAYIRGDFLEQRRSIMQQWWDFIYTSYCAYCAPLPGLEPPKNQDPGE